MSGLPAGWASAKIGDVAASMFDGPFGSALKTSDYTTEGFRVARLENIGHLRFREELNSFVSEEKFLSLSRHVLRADDVLFSSFVDKQTRVCLVPAELDGRMINKADCFCVRPRSDGYDPRLLAYRLAAPASYAVFSDTVRGVTRPRIGLKDLAGYELEVPPLAEQRRIVAKLDALTARTARARADLNRIPVLAARYKAAVLAKAFSGKLTAEWRREHGEVAFVGNEVDLLQRQRAAYQDGRRGSRLREVPSLVLPGQCASLPPTWASGCVADVADLRVGYAFKSGWFKDAGVPIIRGANVGVGMLDCDDLKYLSLEQARDFDAYRLEEGDILLAMDRPLISSGLKIARVTSGEAGALLVQRVASPVPSPLVDPNFLWWLFHSQHYLGQIARHATGSDLPHVSGNDILTTTAPLPPLPEQREIARRIARSIAEIDRMVAEAAAARRLLDRLDQAVLAKGFRGELVPQDPAEEPASVLLDRIRAERVGAPKATRGRRKAAA